MADTWLKNRGIIERLVFSLNNDIIHDCKPFPSSSSFGITEIKGEFSSRLQITCEFIDEVLKNPEHRNEFFGQKYRPAFGHIFYVFLEVFENESFDEKIRLNAASSLVSITDEQWFNISGDSLAIILPGIILKCRKILNSSLDSSSSLEILLSTIKLFTNVVCAVFNFVEVEKSDSKSLELDQLPIKNDEAMESFRRTGEWCRMAAEKINAQLAQILARLCTTSNQAIISQALTMLLQIRKYCKSVLGSSLDSKILDFCIFFHQYSNFCKIGSLLKELLDDLRQDNERLVISHNTAKLKTLIYNLNAGVGDIPSVFQNLVNVSNVMGTDLLDRLIASSTFFLHDLITAILTVLRINRSRLPLYTPNFSDGLDLTLPLDSNLTFAHIRSLAKIFLELNNFNLLLEFLMERFLLNSSSESEQRLSAAYILLSLTIEAEKSIVVGEKLSKNSEKLSIYATEIFDALKTTCNLFEKSIQDDKIENELTIHSNESTFATILLRIIPSLIPSTNIPLTRNQNEILLNATYTLLEFCPSSNIVVAEAARQSLGKIAEVHGCPLAELLLENAPFIIFRVSMDCRDFLCNPRAPLVLSSLMELCPNPKLFSSSKHIVDEFLMALDRHNQKASLVFLYALRNYLRELLNFFPELTPPPSKSENAFVSEEQEDGEKPTRKDENYDVVSSNVKILKRTKHLVSSEHYPVQIVILEMMNIGLKLLRNYENELLPMIHQNWHGLVRKLDIQWTRLTESQKIVATKAVEVMCTMCEISGTFIHLKLVNDFVPRLLQLLGTMKRAQIYEGPEKRRPLTADEKLWVMLRERIPILVEKGQLSAEIKESLSNFFPLKA